MNTELSDKPILKYIEQFALFTTFITTLIFVIGHLSAHYFFTRFRIDYLNYTDTSTAFTFAIQSPLIILIAAIFTTSLLTVYYSMRLTQKDKELLDKIQKEGGSLTKGFTTTFKSKASYIAIWALSSTILYCFSMYEAIEFSDTLKEKRFIPYEVSFNSGENIEKCLTSIGTLGQFHAFISSDLHHILIQSSSIDYVKPLLLPPPIKEPTINILMVSNPNYDKQMTEWLEAWDAVCKKKETNNFRYFSYES